MRFIERIMTIIRRITGDDIWVYSAQASFYILLAAVPFVMLMLSLIRFWLPLDADDLLLTAQTLLPSAVWDFVSDFVDELFHRPNIPLVSATAFTTLWTASRGFAAAERGVRRVYRLPKKGFFSRIGTSLFYTLALAAVLLLTLVLLVFGKWLYTFFAMENLSFMRFSQKIGWLRSVIYFVAVCLLFGLVFHAFTDWKFGYFKHLPGAVFSTIGWMIFSHLYSVYIEIFANYSYIYGSLTAIVLMMLWLYSCMIILLLGAELNMLLFERLQQKGTKEL